MLVQNWVVKFLYKYFFILKAAAEGWRVAYCGGNHFTFNQNVSDISAKRCDTRLNFVTRYSLGTHSLMAL